PPELGRLDGRLRTLVDACLDKDARNRPTSRELLFELLGESDAVPAEVLDSPPAHILRVTPPPLVPEQRSATTGPRPPMAQPEATGTPGGYRLPGTQEGGGPPSGPSTMEPSTSRNAPLTSSRGWPRAVIAVCAALLVTAAVLVTALIPAMNKSDVVQPSQAAGPTVSPQSDPVKSRPPADTSSPLKPERTQQERKPTAGPAAALPVTVPIPSLTGLDKDAATKALKRAGLVLGTVTQLDSPQKIGRVLAAEPAPGTTVAKGSTVSIQVSAGLPVPGVTGLQLKAAEARLTGAGLAVGTVTRSCTDQPDGQVLSTRPKAGSRVTGGTPVALTVARNGAKVPSVVGQSLEDGRKALAGAGFTVRSRGQVVDDESRVGTVLSQTVQPGTCAEPGTAVVIVVGLAAQSGPDPNEPPETPTGQVPGE
ncbi:PASTA domain-containing protein, partial [Nonomuraea sp. NPDC049784]|uniref:PASTA domain-containing protein n=1 Tax=Nonomuraea sp. NPDC049784 TaxID=3154361 RepID=UPI0034032376